MGRTDLTAIGSQYAQDRFRPGANFKASIQFHESPTMQPDLQSSHKPDGVHQGKIGHRPLNEEVLQTAVEAVQSQVPEPLYEDSWGPTANSGLLQRLQEKASRYVVLKPMQASILALGVGATLALLLEQSLKRLIRPKH
jgi:hypothetical protein